MGKNILLGKSNSTKQTADLQFILLVAFFLLLINFVCLGFYKVGLDSPISYSGGDDFSQAAITKSVADFNWIHENRFIGAPYKSIFYDYPSFFLMNTENLIAFIISRFVKNPFKVFNLQYLFTIMLCGITSFMVLRYLSIKRLFAAVGALLYGMSPYIYSRGMGHYCLAACYFIPLSILLCVWVFEDDSNYLSLKNGIKSFFYYKKNISMIVFCFLIANNGIGYYSFFTCFFLCVTALLAVFNTKSVNSINKSVIPICCIVFFMLLALIPVFAYKLNVGSNDIARRSIADLEIYGLKATQLFMPTNGHHFSFIRNIVNTYNSQAPLVTENITAYLGVFACVGFVMMCFFSFIPNKEKVNSTITSLFPRLTIWALLFFSIGGLVTIFCLVTGFRSLRGFNRISIFIEFMGIATTCYCMQSLTELTFFKSHNFLQKIIQILVAVFALFCIYEQHPSIRQNINARTVYKSMRENDRKFVEKIEQQLQENDAVFQLPYHKYPEAGPVRSMSDYQLFAGYLNSSKLHWSYGGMKGQKSDKWNEIVSSLPTEKMVRAIVQSGFRGIYIDSRAYTSEELQELFTSIESVLTNEKPIVSENKLLYFYNLYGYVEKHSELLNLPIFDTEYMPLDSGEQLFFFGAQNNSRAYITTGLSGAEEHFTWTEGHHLDFFATFEDYEPQKSIHSFIDCGVFNGTQRVNVIVNESQRIELVARDGIPLEFDFEPSDNGKVHIEMEFPDAVSPKSLGMSGDPRVLALALKTITFSQSEQN